MGREGRGWTAALAFPERVCVCLPGLPLCHFECPPSNPHGGFCSFPFTDEETEAPFPSGNGLPKAACQLHGCCLHSKELWGGGSIWSEVITGDRDINLQE